LWIVVQLLAVVSAGAAHAAEAGAQGDAAKAAAQPCDPECPSGQTCIGGVCMVPAPRAQQGAYPPPQGGAYPPSQGYPPAQGYPRPQGYLPPPYPPVPPAPGYTPQPGYYAQPGYAPYPGYGPGYPQAAPALEPRKHGFLALPFLGVHSYRNDTATNYDPGLRFGTLLGGRLNQTFSLSGQMTFDISNRNDPAGANVSEIALDMAFSPLVHLPVGELELVFGPKAGIFVMDAESGYARAELSGYSLGVNAGLFVPLGPSSSLGALVAFDLRQADELCTTSGSVSESCIRLDDVDAIKVLGVSAALLF
jgi:hypothetical protein